MFDDSFWIFWSGILQLFTIVLFIAIGIFIAILGWREFKRLFNPHDNY